MSAYPEPPSKVENGNCFALTVACVVSTADTNAVIGTSMVGIPFDLVFGPFDFAGLNGALKPSTVNGSPELLFWVWHAFELVGNIPARGEGPPPDMPM